MGKHHALVGEQSRPGGGDDSVVAGEDVEIGVGVLGDEDAQSLVNPKHHKKPLASYSH